MLLDEADAQLLKAWVIRRLESVSDADPDVLGDYVLALVSTDDTESVAKGNCNDNLKDFLGDASDAFVDDLFQVISTQSYNPTKAKPATTAAYQPSRRTSLEPPPLQNGPRKRSYRDWDRDESQTDHFPGYGWSQRPTKQPRRGGRGGRQPQVTSQHPLAPFPQMPNPPPGMPQFDMNNPIASFMAMQQALGLLPGFALASHNGSDSTKENRCRDFDVQGYCTRGAACPFDHGSNPYIVPDNDEYDPNHATISHVQPNRTGTVRASPLSKKRGRGRGRGGHVRGGGNRSQFSQQGQNYDRSITSIVVEQIPPDKFDEQSVREFFSGFGNVEEVAMKLYKRIAIVKFSSYDSAEAAYNSPKVIFDNRFVKVYWHKPDTFDDPQNGHVEHHWHGTQEDDDQIDMEVIAKKQEEAQQRHNEQRRQREETESKKKELDAQLQVIEVERKKMYDELARKSGNNSASSFITSISGDADEDEQTKGLRAQLAKLEAEAKSLGIDPNAVPTDYHYSIAQFRGRGGFRGRYRGRGRYNTYSRGGWTGVGAVKRLDNRPKTVAITFSEGSYDDHDEALRQWLLFNTAESATLSKHPDPNQQDTALVEFPERYLAENFLIAASGPAFPLVGKVELGWFKPGSAQPTDGQHNDGSSRPAQDVMAHTTDEVEVRDDVPAGRNMDDRADDDDRWE